MTAFGPELPLLTVLAPGVRRLVAPNPSVMTGPGTNTYLFGNNEVAILDPGPVIDAHIDRIQESAAAPIRWVIVTHTHPDHSPAACKLARATGAEILGRPAPDGQHQDRSFVPDRILEDGDELQVDSVALEVIHTPGHASNHICVWHREQDWIFTGDHVIDGSTVVINPPDGDMKHYIESLQRVLKLQPTALAPGHGDLIQDPARAIQWIIEHRLARERKVIEAVREYPGLSSLELVQHVYRDVDKKLYGLAERSLLAHLLKLEADGAAARKQDQWELVSSS